MRLLDLFSGAGGGAMGYHRAGFEVVGVDHAEQPHYPFEFHQADALEFLKEHGHEYDVIHASPPCQKFTTINNVSRARGFDVDHHPDLIDITRKALIETGKVYIIENVQGAPLKTQVILCGYALGLKRLARHRHFESNVLLFAPKCAHRRKPTIGVYGILNGRRVVEKKYYQGNRVAKSLEEASMVMGIDWMTEEEIVLAIPPAYTEYLGRQLMRICKRRLLEPRSTILLAQEHEAS